MALALQVKKFINSEHTGDYAAITLPGFADKSGAAAPEETRIHYLEAGVGEPLLLLHTVGQSLYTWRNAFTALSAHYRVIAIDLLGHGYSGRPEQFDYSIPEQSDALALFMDAKGIESAHVVAFSMGALYAMDFAIKHPERVGKIVLLSPGGITQEMPLSVRILQSPVFGGIACRLYSRKTAERVLSECLFDLTNLSDDMVDQYYMTACDSFSRKAIQLSVLNFDEEEVERALRTVDTPVLILWGGEDKWHTPESSELYHSIMQNAQFSIIRNAGHLLHEEKAARFVEAILEYIPAPMDI